MANDLRRDDAALAALYDPGLEAGARLAALGRLRAALTEEEVAALRGGVGRDVNNHIHTSYSFSPYTPAAAVWEAWRAGLATAGLMDHDAIAGAEEFLAAGAKLGLPVTVGAELRASVRETPLAGRRVNNPDQDGIAYLAFHGVPHDRFEALDAFFRPIRQARARRNRAMLQRLNGLTAGLSEALALDYEGDVLPLSMAAHGGEVTERHLLFALAGRMLALAPEGAALLQLVEDQLGLEIGERARAQLGDAENPHRRYDLLGLLKGELVPRFYVDADETECPPIAEALAFARANGILAAYPYLGDVGDSVTGDKRSQRFEDAWLEELFEVLVALGVGAITYMPSRNSAQQLERLRGLAARHGLFEISGEDINQPRQAFVCEAMRAAEFAPLVDAAWALIGHERAATCELEAGFLSPQSLARWPQLDERIAAFSARGRRAC